MVHYVGSCTHPVEHVALVLVVTWFGLSSALWMQKSSAYWNTPPSVRPHCLHHLSTASHCPVLLHNVLMDESLETKDHVTPVCVLAPFKGWHIGTSGHKQSHPPTHKYAHTLTVHTANRKWCGHRDKGSECLQQRDFAEQQLIIASTARHKILVRQLCFIVIVLLLNVRIVLHFIHLVFTQTSCCVSVAD